VALEDVASAIAGQGFQSPVGVGHRIVHGGPDYNRPQGVTPELLEALRRLVPIDPEHLPQALTGIETMQHAFPEAVQVATFDTAFHREMPTVARLYGVPPRLVDDGVLRYGFHGLSYESIVSQLRQAGEVPEKAVFAHLGNGSSMVAVTRGRSVDTTMGFSPTSGLIMGTRSGDIDPSAVLYLLESRGFSPGALRHLFNRESGLLGLSGTSSDMRDLLASASRDPRAALAVDLYCYVARKFVASMAAALGGLDLLVFTGGIGEYGAEVRRRICSDLGFLGISIDDDKNRMNGPVISQRGSVLVRVVHTDEEATIARHTAEILSGKDEGDHVHV
jgi:acetate kinase